MKKQVIENLLQSPRKLKLTVMSNRDPVDESGYIRYNEELVELGDEETRSLLEELYRVTKG